MGYVSAGDAYLPVASSVISGAGSLAWQWPKDCPNASAIDIVATRNNCSAVTATQPVPADLIRAEANKLAPSLLRFAWVGAGALPEWVTWTETRRQRSWSAGLDSGAQILPAGMGAMWHGLKEDTNKHKQMPEKLALPQLIYFIHTVHPPKPCPRLYLAACYTWHTDRPDYSRLAQSATDFPVSLLT